MRKDFYMTQIALSNKVGWSEANGRSWIKHFREFIPVKIEGKKRFFSDESFSILSNIKILNEKGLTRKEILTIYKENGIPETEEAIKKILKKRLSVNLHDKGIAETLPAQKDLVVPLLNLLRDKKPYTTTMINDGVINHFGLNDEQLNITYPDSREFIFAHRMRLARYSLKKEDYIEEVSKYTYQITEEGLELLHDNSKEKEDEIEELEKVIDPFEIIQDKVEEIESELISDLIDHLKHAHWRRLETIVVELLTSMGYGDGEVTQKSNDGGLDGIIKEDKLGLDKIYVQAKRWENAVGSPDVMGFSGALDAKGAKKGIFITTSNFTKAAEEYVERLVDVKKIVLIDGKKLARLMIENNIGVTNKRKFVIKEVDFSYFEGE
ncbi:restriction endonuclease [Rossellomorea vietnamensis]|uniref:Restriction endonuclease n=1 Tax=Rossellomorea vietnamensis TaxID=218284 RepID=A0A5D4MFC2_9BACI|nr:restriction endonuclease [Rossellomorea vietnamensis]TYS00277.1 restriction endonuclease [Rossellomorea vietnamensis]